MTEKEKQTAEKKCAKCGSCTAVCPVYRASGGKEFYSARGRQFLKQIGEDQAEGTKDIFSNCLLCGACTKVCSKKMDNPAHVRSIRGQKSIFPGGYKKYIVGKMLAQPQVVAKLGQVQSTINKFAKRLPKDSGLRIKLAMLAEDDSPHEIDNDESLLDSNLKPLIYYPGCATGYLEPIVFAKINQLFSALGYRLVIPEGLKCCGLAHYSAGDLKIAQELAAGNIKILSESEVPILISCASCFYQLKGLKNIVRGLDCEDAAIDISERIVEISSFLVAEIEDSESDATTDRSATVYYHDPCHMRNELEITSEPRELLKRAGYEILELAGGQQCCGMGGLFHIDSPQISNIIRDDLAKKIIALQPDIITTTCSGCLMQLRSALVANHSDIKVQHLSEIL